MMLNEVPVPRLVGNTYQRLQRRLEERCGQRVARRTVPWIPELEGNTRDPQQ